ncbi:MAG: hypothetical protein QOJ07_3635 [Thermoleophilaceae bacterium]|nr:hypothetical protein [Thermoleophilaceae bacterium]
MQMIHRIRARLSDESGFTMVVVMGVLLVATLFSVAAIASADKDIAPSRADIDRKEAYAAAEAGLNDYMSRLNQDSNYWTNCSNVPAPAPVNPPFSITGAAGRKWRLVPGSTEADYSIELMPAAGSGYTQCDPANPAASMIDANGSFTIRSTGRSRASGTGPPAYRTITASFRRRGFLDFLYFTDFETTDPEFFRSDATRYSAALTQCAKYSRNGRPTGNPCADITFVDADAVRGPLHTNDRLLVQGHPDFGRTSADQIETSAANAAAPAGPAWEANGTGDPNPFNGTFAPGAPILNLPPSNSQLSTIADVTYTGDTHIVFNGGTTMTVTNRTLNPVAPYTSTEPLPANGVIYVKNGTCSQPIYDASNPYQVSPATYDYDCANVWVSGSYNKSMTIASEGDVIIDPNSDPGSGAAGKGLRRSGDVMMGLIANNFIRVRHQVASTPCDSGTANTASGTTNDVMIDAAILSLNHSFTVDNYACGSKLGTLTVNGAIAQKFRGPVGTFGGSGTGYIKNYTYDDRLIYRSPPFFLDPVQSAWRTVRVTERSPADK